MFLYYIKDTVSQPYGRKNKQKKKKKKKGVSTLRKKKKLRLNFWRNFYHERLQQDIGARTKSLWKTLRNYRQSSQIGS